MEYDNLEIGCHSGEERKVLAIPPYPCIQAKTTQPTAMGQPTRVRV